MSKIIIIFDTCRNFNKRFNVYCVLLSIVYKRVKSKDSLYIFNILQIIVLVVKLKCVSKKNEKSVSIVRADTLN